jgi:hypothetical protein
MTNKEVQNITLESLRDWFKKEKWVRISSSGNIAGDCGTSKNKKNPDRCLPKAKAQSLSKAERAATARKKKAAGKKGKTVVANTKKATVKKENQDRSWSREDMETYIDETIGGYLERYLGHNPGPPNHPMYKMTPEQFSAYIAQEFISGIDELMDEVDTSIEFLRDVIEDAYEERKKIAMGVGHDPDMHFEPEEEKIGADALELVLQTLDKMATPTKLETANPQDGKAAPYGSGYKPTKKMKEEKTINKSQIEKLKDMIKSLKKSSKGHAGQADYLGKLVNNETKEAPAGHYFTKSGNLVKGRLTQDAKERGARKSDPKDNQRSKVPAVTQYKEIKRPSKQGLKRKIRKAFLHELTKEDIKNLVVGTIAEMQNENTITEKDDRCTRLAKSKYDTWPSAYASGAVVRCRRGEIWKKK